MGLGRGTILALVGVSLLASSLTAGATESGDSRKSEPVIGAPPNILIVVTDDQRLDSTLQVMPQLRQKMLGAGAEFTNAFVTTPTCCPSRSSIMTGQYVHNHGVRSNEKGQAANLDQSTTMQSYLQTSGYRTGLFGKFLNGWPQSEPPPYFDRWALFSDRSASGYSGGRWNVQGRVTQIDTYSTSFIERKATSFIQESSQLSQPWFLYLSPYAPHSPYQPERRYQEAKTPKFVPTPAMFEEDRSDKPPEVQQPPVRPGWVERIRRRQLKTLMSIDDLMDRLFDELEGAGASENTLVIFTSDNGFLWGEHGRTGKRYPYQDSVQVPLLAWWPGHIAGGSDERLVANIDIAPTVLDAAGIEPEHVVDGRSLLDPSLERDRLLLEYFRREGRETPHWASLMTDAYQYVEYYADDRLVPNFREYYDLASDPWQLENLLGNDSVADDPISVGPALQLLQDVNCAGTSGQRACP